MKKTLFSHMVYLVLALFLLLTPYSAFSQEKPKQTDNPALKTPLSHEIGNLLA